MKSPPSNLTKQKSVRINSANSDRQKKAEQNDETQQDKPTKKVNMRRIAQLAKPVQREQFYCSLNKWRVSDKALYYRASWRIKNLAYPRWIVPKVVNRRRRTTGLVSNVSPKALKYKATDRIIDLSLPKGFSYA